MSIMDMKRQIEIQARGVRGREKMNFDHLAQEEHLETWKQALSKEKASPAEHTLKSLDELARPAICSQGGSGRSARDVLRWKKHSTQAQEDLAELKARCLLAGRGPRASSLESKHVRVTTMQAKCDNRTSRTTLGSEDQFQREILMSGPRRGFGGESATTVA